LYPYQSKAFSAVLFICGQLSAEGGLVSFQEVTSIKIFYFLPIAMTPCKAAVTITDPLPINVDNSRHITNGSNAKLTKEVKRK
jgi:hypothetical protein